MENGKRARRGQGRKRKNFITDTGLWAAKRRANDQRDAHGSPPRRSLLAIQPKPQGNQNKKAEKSRFSFWLRVAHARGAPSFVALCGAGHPTSRARLAPLGSMVFEPMGSTPLSDSASAKPGSGWLIAGNAKKDNIRSREDKDCCAAIKAARERWSRSFACWPVSTPGSEGSANAKLNPPKAKASKAESTDMLPDNAVQRGADGCGYALIRAKVCAAFCAPISCK